MNTQTMNLDVTKRPQITPVLYLGQGDKSGTILEASIYDNGLALTLTSYSVKLCIQTPNGAGYYECEGTVSGNKATFTIDETYAATVDGVSEIGYVEVLSGDTVICSTNRFRTVVLKNATEGADPNGAYTNGVERWLENAQDELDDAVEASDAAAERATAAAEAAEGIILDDIPTMSPTIKGGALLGDGLHVTDYKLSLGPLTQSAEGAQVATHGCAIFGVEGEGWSEQDTTVGKNLFNGTLSEGYYNSSTGVANTNSAHVKTSKVDVQPSTDYVLSMNKKDVSTNIYAYYWDSSGTYISGGAIGSISGARAAIAITTPSNAAKAAFALGHPNSPQALSDVSEVQLELGSTSTSYEPYTGGAPSPSPDYPQEIRVCRGRNLLDRSKSTLGYYINDAGVETANSASEMTDFIPVEAGNYVIKFLERTAGNLRLHGYSADKATVTLLGKTNPGAGAYGTIAVEIPSTISWVRASFYTNSEEVQFEASPTPTPYVPYGHVGLEVQGRNLLNESACATKMYVDSSGQNHSSSGLSASDYIEVEPSTAYVLSGIANSGSTAQHAFYDASLALISTIVSTTYSFTTPSNCKYVKLSLRSETPSGVMFNEGSTAIAYEPYHHTVTPVPLPSKGWAGALPDGTADALAIDSAGRWEWTNGVAEKVFDGSSDEGWALQNYDSSSDITCVKTSIVNDYALVANLHTKILCSHFVVKRSVNNSGDAYAGGVGLVPYRNSSNSSHVLFFNTSGESTVSIWEDWLSTHNVTVLYLLATPTKESGYIDLPDLPNGATVSIPELESIGVSWLVEGARPITDHISNVYQRIESLIAELATS